MLRLINKYFLLFLLVAELLIASNVKWGRERWKQVIAFDGKGYYAYLPAIFIYHDLTFSFHDSIDDTYSSPHTYFDFRKKINGDTIDKYFAGTAIAMAPFFLAGHLLTLSTGGIADGYSFYYQLAISIAGIVYGLIGLYYLRRLLRLFHFREHSITLTLAAFSLATPLFYYTLFEPSMSHVYSFAFITLFLFKIKQLESTERPHLVSLSAIVALIILTRPVNGVIIFCIPFIIDSVSEYSRLRKSASRNTLLLSALAFGAILFIQPLIYHYQSGQWFLYSYGDERLVWNQPHVFEILFSYKKGLFVYAPLLFVSLFGLIPLYRKSKLHFYSFILFFLLLSYTLSCWSVWWYGGSFGFRPFIEYYSLFAILFASVADSIRKKIPVILLAGTSFACLIICQVQTYQYRYMIIHWEKMDREHYWRVFMRVDEMLKKVNANADLLQEP